MEKLNSLLGWLDGKKSIISGLISVVNSYLVTAGLYDASIGSLIQSLVLILTGGAVYQTNVLKGKK